jgi:cellobiose epimerase
VSRHVYTAQGPAKPARRRVLGSLLMCFAGACDVLPGARRHIDTAWHRQSLLDDHLSRWLAVAPTASGLFRTSFTRDWKPNGATPSDLTAQSRLVYAMASGYELTQDTRYLDAATLGADFLLEHFRDPVHGGFFQSVGPDGQILSADKHTYGHAFALFALAHMFRIGHAERFRDAALLTWKDIDRGLRDGDGGFRPEAPRDFAPTSGARNQNPLMHMFEALLALCDATDDPMAREGAASVGHFAVYRLLQGQADGTGCIPEWYDEHWRPLQTRDVGYIDIGHQFEWSHLLLGAESRGLQAILSASSERILQYAVKLGYDEFDGGSFNTVDPDGKVHRDKFWWEQCECIRALLAAAVASGRHDMWRRYEQSVDFVRAQFVDSQNGGWRTGPASVCERSDCPNEQPDPYHMTGMHMAALKLAQAR